MKTPILCTCLVYFIGLTIATAQPDCDTLILYPERKLLVSIDSIAENKVYGKICDDLAGNTQIIPLKMVAEIRRNAAGENPEGRIVDTDAIKEGNNPPAIPSWLFTKKANKKIQRKLERGLKVKVTHNDPDEDKTRDDTGQLMDISEKQVIIDVNKQGVLEIPKEHILKITPKRKISLVAGIVSGLAFGLGLTLILLVILLLLLALFLTALLSGGRNSSTSGVEEDANTGCSWALIALFIGFIALFFAIPKSIRAPFSDEWQVEKVIGEEAAKKAIKPENPEEDEGFNTP